MASEHISSDPHRFRNQHSRQPPWDALSSPLITSSEASLLPLQTSLLATAFPVDFVEHSEYNARDYAANCGVFQDSPWTQIPTDHVQATHSPFADNINHAVQTPSTLELHCSDSLTNFSTSQPAFQTLPNMATSSYYQHGVRASRGPMPSVGDNAFSQELYSYSQSFSPLSPTSTVGVSPSQNDGCHSFGDLFPSSSTMTSDFEEDINNEPYAKLIYRALIGAPRHRMVLKDIYEWFEVHTNKARDPKSKGWQNSIRHNLSMNGAFRKEEQLTPSGDGKRNYVWVLEQAAIEAGEVQSTTRYRRSGAHKKPSRFDPSYHRQRSGAGAKGGRASRGKQHRRQRSAASFHNAFYSQTHLPPTDADIDIKTEPNEPCHLTPYMGSYTGIEHALPLSPQALSLGQVIRGPLTSAPSPTAQEWSLVHNISPTPTLTNESTDPENHDFDHITICTDIKPGEPFFCTELGDHTRDATDDRTYWNHFNANHGLPNLDPMLGSSHHFLEVERLDFQHN